MKKIATNRRAFFDYQILEEFEAGLVLVGPEIKAIRSNRINITGSYVKPFQSAKKNQEFWWIGSNFEVDNGDKARTKKILLSTNEIKRLLGKLSSGNYTIIPLELYLKRGVAKLKIALATRKKTHDKRETIKRRDSEREIAKQFRRKEK
jgi:SsrA-binding protein